MMMDEGVKGNVMNDVDGDNVLTCCIIYNMYNKCVT